MLGWLKVSGRPAGGLLAGKLFLEEKRIYRSHVVDRDTVGIHLIEKLALADIVDYLFVNEVFIAESIRKYMVAVD